MTRSSARSTSHVERATERWAEGLEEELQFWFRWLRDREPWSDMYVQRTDPNSELQPAIRAHLDSPANVHLRLLDVGSGPLTILGKRWSDRILEITAVDPLADRYAVLFKKVGLEPLVWPVAGEAERLTDRFAESSFDLVYARNCLDHSYDPLRAILQMLRVVKPGRVALLEHAVDEGEYMKYAGPHQWNFRIEEGRFVIWQPGLRVDAHTVLEKLAEVEAAEGALAVAGDPRYMHVALRKR